MCVYVNSPQLMLFTRFTRGNVQVTDPATFPFYHFECPHVILPILIINNRIRSFNFSIFEFKYCNPTLHQICDEVFVKTYLI